MPSAEFPPVTARRQRRCRGPFLAYRDRTPAASRIAANSQMAAFGCSELPVGRRVVGNQIHVIEMAAHEPRQLARADGVVVNTGEHDVLEEDFAIRLWT